MTAAPAKCPICQHTLSTYPLCEKEGYEYVSCRACGSALLHPWPDTALIDKFIASIEPQAVHVPQPARQIGAAEKIFQKSLPQPVAGKKRFLDTNAMWGYTTVAARNLGYEVTGLNMWQYFHDFAASNYGAETFRHTTLQDYAREDHKADVILSVKALGLQTDPDSYLTALKSVLAKDGVIYIDENDGNHFNTPRNFYDWNVVEPPLTCSVLSKKGVEALLARHGLKINKSYFTWAPYMRLLVGHAK